MGTILKNQVALVTGAGSGIGEACALGLAKEGASVIINYYVEEEEAQKVVTKITDAGGKAVAIHADVSLEDEVKHMFDKAVIIYGQIDIVVCNAGIQKDNSFIQMSISDWKQVLDTNLSGAFITAQSAVKQFLNQAFDETMSKARGKIIFMSSVHQAIPWAGHVNYAASKGGMEELMKSLAQELSQKNIRINAIAPGAIKTPINQSVWHDAEKSKALMKLIPYQRLGEPEDVANAVVWLASDQSDYVIGTTLFVDGGMMLYPGFINNG